MRVITPLCNLDHFPDRPDCPALTLCREKTRIVGAFYLAPQGITAVYDRALAALGTGRVLIVYIDGLGYSLYDRSRLPFIKRTFACTPARSAYPPLTQPCMASMLTGVWPDAHGIFSRRDHKPASPSLMAVPGAIWIEADTAPLTLEKPPILTLPRQDEDVDGAVLRAALPAVQTDAPLVIVHFHGLDDLQHDVGDDLPRLQAKLTWLDHAVEHLCAAFHGTAILCADHGVHREGDAGAHGAFDYRDMFVPLGEAVL